MMKYLTMVFAILFCLSFTAPSMANDETQNNEQAPNTDKLFKEMFRLPSFVDCGTPEKVLEMISQYGEKEMAQGLSFLIRPDQMLQPGPMSIYVNPQTGTWTMVIKYAPQGFPVTWCIMGAGSAFGPVIGKTSI
tara:strand:- start:3790 stop:4191 length:402 start_codon:yes stop_codon:yes gene_type:complete